MDQTKTTPVYLSKTMWLNVITLFVLVLNTMVGWDFMPKESIPYLMASLSMANMALRFLTKTEVSLTGQAKDPSNL